MALTPEAKEQLTDRLCGIVSELLLDSAGQTTLEAAANDIMDIVQEHCDNFRDAVEAAENERKLANPLAVGDIIEEFPGE